MTTPRVPGVPVAVQEEFARRLDAYAERWEAALRRHLPTANAAADQPRDERGRFAGSEHEDTDAERGMLRGNMPDTGNIRRDTRTYLTSVLPEEFYAYRKVHVPQGQEADLASPGDYWAETAVGARVSGYSDSGRAVVLRGLVRREHIDVDTSISRRLRYGEPEIVLTRKPTGVHVYEDAGKRMM